MSNKNIYSHIQIFEIFYNLLFSKGTDKSEGKLEAYIKCVICNS